MFHRLTYVVDVAFVGLLQVFCRATSAIIRLAAYSPATAFSWGAHCQSRLKYLLLMVALRVFALNLRFLRPIMTW